jgi:hypothetical protein
LLEPASPAWHGNDEWSYWKSTSSGRSYSKIGAQGADGRFEVRYRDGSMTEIGRAAAATGRDSTSFAVVEPTGRSMADRLLAAVVGRTMTIQEMMDATGLSNAQVRGGLGVGRKRVTRSLAWARRGLK